MDTLAKLDCPARVGNCIQQLICKPVGRIRGSAEFFTLERGVKQGRPHLFNLVFDEILRKVYEGLAPTTRMTQDSGDHWSVSHIAYADDLCLITSSLSEMRQTLERLNTILQEWGMAISFTKTKWMAITPSQTDDAQLIIDGQEIEKVHRFKYLGSIIEDDGSPKSAVSSNIKRARYALIRIRCALRSNRLTMDMKSHLIECYVKPVLYYGLETIVLTAQLSDRMEAVLNTARRMILGLNNRKVVKVEELKRKVALEAVAPQLQKRRLNLWVSMHKASNTYARKVMCSKLSEKRSYRTAHTKHWLRQLRNDAQQCRLNVEDWIRSPVHVSPHDQVVRPKLVGRRERHIICADSNCSRLFANNQEMYRHVREDHSQQITRHEHQHKCPVRRCHKTFRTPGWLKSHINKCHPGIQPQPPPPADNIQPATTANPVENGDPNLHQCPYPNCKKALPTRKGIVSHCNRAHSSSTIAGKTTIQGKKQTAMRVP